MTARTSIIDEANGIGAPKIWLTRLFQTGTAANWSSVDRDWSFCYRQPASWLRARLMRAMILGLRGCYMGNPDLRGLLQ
jgi:hypothetical protein